MECINQNMTTSLTDDNHISKPIGKIHKNVKTYNLTDPDGFNWGDIDFCDKCKNKYIALGWKCIEK